MNEHEYMEWLITDRYFLEVEQYVHPVQDRARTALFAGKLGECDLDEAIARGLKQAIFTRRIHREDVLRRLKLDTDVKISRGLQGEEKISPAEPRGWCQMSLNPHESHEFVKASRGRCYLRAIKIGDVYVNKAFCNRCPKCDRTLPGMLSNEGHECCLNQKCDYQRQVFTAEELMQLGKKK
ncbi:MAG: hypothetical protein KME17_23775 [Cyanosarcina radialis HA8281-LM2]|jgi:hypothetical protein|nr:hypothetical protein [Cyanosarcina radialis HA8281-LM2]